MLLTVPLVAIATTGTQTDLTARITITGKGTTWSPKKRQHGATTATTVRFHVVNKGPGRHWFQIGKRKTKLLAKGHSQIFFYSYTKPGKVAWRSGPGKGLGSGKVTVKFPNHFH